MSSAVPCGWFVYSAPVGLASGEICLSASSMHIQAMEAVNIIEGAAVNV